MTILIPQYRTARRASAAPAAPPLDGYTTNLWGAWSTRVLLTAYTGNLIRVRRSSDSTEQDIGQSAGLLDESALTSFVGAGDGYVVTYYDQSGNGRNLTAVDYDQRIVTSGSIERLGAFAANNHHGGSVSGGYLSSTRPNAITLMVSLNTTDTSCVVITKQAAEPSDFRGVWQSGSGLSNVTTGSWVNGSATGTTRDNLHDAVSVGANVVITIDSSSIVWFTPSQWLLFGYNNGGYEFAGKWLDAVAYSVSGLSDRAAIETALGEAI